MTKLIGANDCVKVTASKIVRFRAPEITKLNRSKLSPLSSAANGKNNQLNATNFYILLFLYLKICNL